MSTFSLYTTQENTHIRKDPSEQHAKKRGVKKLTKKTTHCSHLLCPKIAIIILLFRRDIDLLLLLRRFSRQDMYRVLIRSVDVRLGCRNSYFYCVVAFGSFDDSEVCADFIVAFRTP